jgi:hypothetical protein
VPLSGKHGNPKEEARKVAKQEDLLVAKLSPKQLNVN